MCISIKYAIVLLLITCLSLGQETENSVRKQNIGSCLYLIRAKLDQDMEEMEKVIYNLPKEIDLMVRDKIIADMLSGCMKKISREVSLKFWETFELLPEHEYLLDFDKNQFHN